MQKSHYQILGIDQTASQDEILSAFQALRSRLQERANRGDGEAVNQLKFANEAFAILRNPESRRLYDEKRSSIRAITSPQAGTTGVATALGGGRDDGDDRDDPPSTIRRIRTHLRRSPATVVISVILPIVVAVGLWAMRPTEEGHLKRRAVEYMAQFGNLNFEAAYDYLAPDLRELVSRDAYVKSRSSELGVNAKIVDVEVTVPAQRGYALVESREGRTRINWVMIDGEWYRDLGSDRSEVVTQLLAVSEKINVGRALPVPLGLWEVHTRWSHHQSLSKGGTIRYFVRPVTSFHVINEGEEDINYLDVMVEYYDSEAGAKFGMVSGNLVGYADRPLGPRRKVRWINGDLSTTYEMDFGEWGDALKNQPVMVEGDNPIIDRIEVHIYARQAPKTSWTRLQ